MIRDQAPLVAAYLDAVRGNRAPLTTPGNHRRAARISDDLGAVVDADVPVFAGLGSMKGAIHAIEAAEAQAARLWGADWLRFSVNGSTHGNQTAALSIGRPGDEILVTRTLHRSTASAMVLAGLRPVWLLPRIDDVTGMPMGIDVATLEAALAAHPNAAGVFLVEPGYLGTFSDVAALIDVAHQAGKPVVVDQAWGAHLGFATGLPPHALSLGADAMITSIHKSLPGYCQASLVAAQGERLDLDRLESAFDAIATTSPTGAIMASIDGCRALLEHHGERLMVPWQERAARVRAAIRDRVPGIVVPEPDHFGPNRYDPTKVTLLLQGTGADGVAVENDLYAEGIDLELVDRDTIVAMVTLVDTDDELDRFIDLVCSSIQSRRGPAREVTAAVSWRITPETVIEPREAFFAPVETVSASDAIGRVSAELIAPYPPGVPVLAPGERVTAEIVDGLRAAAADGVRIAYAADPRLDTFRVLRGI